MQFNACDCGEIIQNIFHIVLIYTTADSLVGNYMPWIRKTDSHLGLTSLDCFSGLVTDTLVYLSDHFLY